MGWTSLLGLHLYVELYTFFPALVWPIRYADSHAGQGSQIKSF
jgi:hypothetical protein